jgi:hypothetical protein
VTEPLNVIQTDRPVGQTVERMLASQARLAAERVRAFERGATYYPSPGGVQEEVSTVFVHIDPVLVDEPIDLTPFSTSGRVRAIEARQLLRAAQVGGLPDARLELAAYDLLVRRGRPPGPWIGEALDPCNQTPPDEPSRWVDVAVRPARRAFTPVSAERSQAFIELRASRFEELDERGTTVGRADLEYVVPRTLGLDTIACALLWRVGDEVYLGADDDDLPAAQAFTGNSHLLVAPAWRVPRDIESITPARAWIVDRLRDEYALEVGEVWELGGRYFPSPGVTPEVVHPLAVEVRTASAGGRPLTWLPLRTVTSALPILRDGHLRIVALRAAHALGFV